MNISEEKLEQRLRTLFADERLDLPPPLDAGTRIVEGARRRRRRRRMMMSASGVAAAAIVVTGGLAIFKVQSPDSAAVMSGGQPELSIHTTDNPAADTSPQPTGSAPTSTGSLQVSPPPGTGLPSSKTSAHSTTTPKAPPVQTGPLLLADGFGSLRIGMTQAQATSAGVTLTKKEDLGACTLYTAEGGGLPVSADVAISAANGLVILTPTVPAHTAEGIGAGSTREAIHAAYPAATDVFESTVVAPAAAGSSYHFRLDAKSTVSAVSLYGNNQDCVS